MLEADVADHAFLDGRLVLREPRRGHRSGTDAVLLAAAARVTSGQHVIDAGAGAGAVALAVLSRAEDVTATLIERDPAMAALARHNIQANGFGDRAEVLEGDIFDRALPARRADIVLSNPPFYLPGQVRSSSIGQRARSHVLEHGHHGDWLRALLGLASAKGHVVLIHRPEALPGLVQAAQGRAALRMRGIHPKVDETASRLILVATLGRREPFAIEAPLLLHREDGRFTSEAEALHRGRSWL